jgi:Fe2+ transport system protein FeoA
MKKKLSHIDSSTPCVVSAIETEDLDLMEELETLGFIPGTVVKVINKSFLSGPLTVFLRGAKVAIRKGSADIISVTA